MMLITFYDLAKLCLFTNISKREILYVDGLFH